jgi:NADH dehydrogenase [ubiquinone] 1 alpha subcomplex assembly factor 7
MSYDPDLRRDTPLALKLKARIRESGPITVCDYAHYCLYDDEHGYYRNKAAIGGAGDFVTAPEISQIFGELIGLWCIAAWQQMGSPERFHLVEFGPGRGTMMRDMLRAQKLAPDFLKAAQVTLFESSEVLRDVQKKTLEDAPVAVRWRFGLTPGDFECRRVPGTRAQTDTPLIIVGNEYLDVALPNQYIRKGTDWYERQICLDDNDLLFFCHSAEALIIGSAEDRKCLSWPWVEAFWTRASQTAKEGDVVEPMFTFGSAPILAQWANTVAALFIDYGHVASGLGDTLQAVRSHAWEHPLTSPGEADLTTQVNFELFKANYDDPERHIVDGPVTQAEFLGQLGIMQRASKLMAANPTKAGELETGVARLMAPNGMGTRFKAIGVRSRGLPPLPGFPSS